jgi:hypothetical protein
MAIDTHAHENAISNLKECKARKIRVDSYPLKIYIEPTFLCNLDCIYCYPIHERPSGYFDMNLFREIEKQLFPHCSEVNLFLRGEPTMAKCFPEMLDICSKYPFITKTFSNLSYKNDAILRKIVESGVFINISFDSFKIANLIRRGTNTDFILRNIDLLQTYQAEIKNPRFHMRLAVVVSKLNVGEVLDIVKRSHDMGFKEIMLGCLDGIYYKRLHMLTAEDAPVFEEAVRLADSLGLRISTPTHIGGKKLSKVSNWNDFELEIDKYFPHYTEDSNPDVETKFCPYPWIQTVFTYDAQVLSCCQRKSPLGKFAMGMDFMKDVWNNAEYVKLRGFSDFQRCMDIAEERMECGLLEYSIWGGEQRLAKI